MLRISVVEKKSINESKHRSIIIEIRYQTYSQRINMYMQTTYKYVYANYPGFFTCNVCHGRIYRPLFASLSTIKIGRHNVKERYKETVQDQKKIKIIKNKNNFQLLDATDLHCENKGSIYKAIFKYKES